MPKNQYHHFIPRFILRYFQDAQSKPQNRKERQKNFWKARKTGVDLDTVQMYDLTSQTFETRPVGKVYGVLNLYRDVQNPENVDHLEEEFSRLENDASVILKKIHSSLTPTSKTIRFQMKRKELNMLRKFMFLMFQRKATLVDSYYDEDHPENAPIGNWIKAFKTKTKIKTKEEMWLHGLRYNLFTPHHKIVAEAEAIKKRYGTMDIFRIAKLNTDPDITSWYALDYESNANGYFLGIWEAAIGEEFILTSTSFGLWEGTMFGQGKIHKLFVMSPRIALVLRSGVFPVLSRGFMNSDWLDIPMERPACQYANFIQPNSGDQKADAEVLAAYRATESAQEDIFTFQTTRLTTNQTHLVNNTLLLNAKVASAVTFSSTTAMANTTQAFLTSQDPFAKECAHLYRSLLGVLLDPVSSTVDPPRSTLDIVLESIISGAREFPSTYSRAYHIYHLATNNTFNYARTSSEIHKMAALGIIKLKAWLGLPETMHQFAFQLSFVPIVAELPKGESELFFALAGHQIDKLGIGSEGGDMLERFKYEAAVIGIVHWISDNKKAILHEWLYPWVDIFTK